MALANANTNPSALPDLWGTYVSQGLRVGPSSREEGLGLPTLNQNEVYSPSQIQAAEARMVALDQWGPGAYTGGLFTYRILPTPVNELTTSSPTALGQANIVSQFNLAANSFNTPLSLSGTLAPTSQVATQRYVSNGVTALQIDYPRTVAIYQDAAQTAAYNVKVYGTDFYGQLMMETIPVAAAATLVFGKKAFWKISAVYLTDLVNAIAAAKYLAIGTSNIFGLPYSLNQICHTLYYSQGDRQLEALATQGNQGYREGSANFPANMQGALTDFLNIPYQVASPRAIVGQDFSTATATTGDVRGTVWPRSNYQWTTGPAVNSTTTPGVISFSGIAANASVNQWTGANNPYITLTYYMAGADMFQNQMLGIQNAVAASWGGSSAMWQKASPYGFAPLRNEDGIKGVAQYWEAPPA